jgi:hypothetical protein
MRTDTCAPWEPAIRDTLEPEATHDVRDRVMPDMDLAAVAQLCRHALSAVDATRGAVHVGDLTSEPQTPERCR